MIYGSWVCLLAPLAGFLAILLAGTRITRRQAGILSTASVFVGFAGALVAFFDAWGREPEERGELTTAWTWLEGGRVRGRARAPDRPALARDDARRHRDRRADRPLLERVHGGRRRGAPLLRLHGVLRLLDAPARDGREPAPAPRRLGPRRPRLLPPDRLPPRTRLGGRRREEGVRDQRPRRRAHGARLLPPDRQGREPRLRRRLRGGRVGRALGHRRDARRARPARRRGREVGADPLPHLAPGRDGGPDPRLRADPRGDDGHRRRLPHLPHAPRLRGGAGGAAPRRDPRARHAARRRRRRSRPVGHQARDRLLHDEPDRLHVHRGRRRRVRLRDVPSRHARLLQGAPLSRSRARDPPPLRGAGHPEDGRASLVDALHAPGVPRRARSRSSGSRRSPGSGRRTRSSPRPSPTVASSAGCSTWAGSSGRCSRASTRSVSTCGSSTASPRRMPRPRHDEHAPTARAHAR